MKGVMSISSALVFGIAIVAVALYVASNKEPVTALNAVEVADKPTRAYIPVPDTDADGVSDWEESFEKRITVNLPKESSEGEYEVPTTVTGAYAMQLFSDFMYTSQGEPLTDAQRQDLVKNAFPKNLAAKEITPYKLSDLNLGENTLASFREYGNAIASIILAYASETRDNEIAILTDIYNNGEEEIDRLTPVLITYRQFVEDMLLLSTPSEFSDLHLRILNGTQTLLEDITVFTKAYEDPLLVVGYITKYQNDRIALEYNISSVFNILTKGGVHYADDEPVNVLFYKLRTPYDI
ncbi:hypothetical protein OAD26_00035 [bacterium]|nr:hypothetical protein [bacterium]